MLDLMSPQLEYNMSDDQARRIEDFLKKKRIEAGYARQEDAARDIGVSQDLISRLESRFSPNIRVGEFGRVLRAYNVPPNDAYELIGLYIPMESDTDKKEYMRKELIPLMSRFDLPGLRTVKRVIESLLPRTSNEEGKPPAPKPRSYRKVPAKDIRRGDTIRVFQNEGAEDEVVQRVETVQNVPMWDGDGIGITTDSLPHVFPPDYLVDVLNE